MSITRVTITGADGSISPSELIEISNKYPFVEWGILVSKSQQGGRRFPSLSWIKELIALKNEGTNLSLHLCGRWVKDLLNGDFTFINNLSDIWDHFPRVQINTHAEPHDYHKEAFLSLALMKNKEFIFQYDDVNVDFIDIAYESKVNFSALFDLSHGIGILPSSWPDLLSGVKCGYAGGLSPLNLEEQIKKIENKAGLAEIWIDMETHVRSNNDALFDLKKVIQCLEISKSNCLALQTLPIL